MHADADQTLIIGADIAVVGAARAVRLVVVQARTRPIADVRVRAVIVRGITTGRPGRMVWMSTDPGGTNVARAFVPVVRARRSIRLVIVQADARAIAGIRIRAVIIQRVTASRPGRQVRMRAGAGGTDIIGAIIPVVRARGSVGFMIVQTGSGAVASVRARTVAVRGITTGRPGRQVGMRASTRGADIIGAVVAVIRTCRAIRLVIVQTRTRAVARIGIGAVVVRRVATGRPDGKIWMRTGTGAIADIVRAVVAVIYARRATRLVIV